MSVTNESRIRSWFQFSTKSSNTSSATAITANNNNTNGTTNGGNAVNNRSDNDDNNPDHNTTANTTSSNTLLDRVTSFRRSLGKAQNKKHKIRYARALSAYNGHKPASVKGLTTGAAVEQQCIAKSKNSPVRKGSSPTSVVTSGGSAISANCDDDEIYGFTSANFDSSNSSTRRQLKSSLASNACNSSNASNAPNISAYDPVRKGSSPTSVVTSGGSAISANCDDDEIYGFTSANFDSSNNSTRRQLKSSLASNACNSSNASNAPNISAYESETNKSGRVRNEERDRDESEAITATVNTTPGAKTVLQDSPEWFKADKEFAFYNQQNQLESRESIQNRIQKYYKQQYFHDSDVNLRHSSAQRLSWIAPNGSEIETEVDRIYENMRDISTAFTNAQQRHYNHRNSTANANNVYANSANSLSDNNNTVNHNNRKLTKDSGYESASASISNWGPINANNANALPNNYFHSRSDSNASSVSNGGLSPRTATNSAKSAYHHHCDQWSAAKSTSNLPLQVHVSGSRRSSLSGSGHPYPEHMMNAGKSVLPAKSVPGGLDRDSDDNIVKKRSHNRNNPTPSSVYSLLASKSGLDFAPVLKSNRKSCGPSFAENSIVSKYNERLFSKNAESNTSQFWKSRDRNVMASYGQYDTDDSPPPTPPVRDSSLSSNRKLICEPKDNESQNKLMTDSLGKGVNDCHYYKNNNSQYYMKGYSESRVSHIGCSKSLINLRSKYDDSSDLKQFSQTYPLLPETEFNDKSSQMQESWSCDQSVTSGVTSLVTTSDYFTASSSVITHSPSLSSLSTTATNTTTASYNNSRNSIASTGSSSQIAKSSKVVQPKRESASVLYYEKSGSPSNMSQHISKSEVPPPPPPKLHLGDSHDKDIPVRTSIPGAPNMVSTSRTIETSKSHRASDPEIKAIQKRAVYQFYLKQKQKGIQENSSNNNNNNINDTNNSNNNNSSVNSNTPLTASTIEDNSQIPSRKVQLVVHENIYENSSAQCMSPQPSLPSPPLPPPPQQTVADIEFDGELPLPPPPTAHECDPKSATTLSHSNSHNIDICDPFVVSNGKPMGRSPSPPKDKSLPAPNARPAEVWQKSEIATQTTETLRRHSSASAKDMTIHEHKPSLETSEPMYENSVSVPINETTTAGEQQQQQQSGTNKSMESVESVVPWAYCKLWPNEKCVKTADYESDSSYISVQTSSPIVAANTFIGDIGVGLANEELLTNKSDLISRLNRKLDVLRIEEMALTQDVNSNEILGQHVRTKLKALGLTEQESEKMNLHCEEIEKVTRLLLSISARLQLIDTQIHEKRRQKCLANESHESKHNSIDNSMAFESTLQTQTFTQNDLQQIRDKQSKQNAFSSHNLFDEMQSLVCKRQKLLDQLQEALQLRVCIDQRNQSIEEKIIRKYFKDNFENLNEFLEFIKLKSKLIVNIREVKDQILMGEKHLCALRAS
ncbi:unnamed protein product [Oppiella nova]|uniref:ASD2 domain-containing protein n=1 Tax=Oppiella nova TaxID=334625 RepID=A0A7R9Q9B4_9ACAR|nr:unnamed protein product [Oppiella nova]CAG2159591.1 unnamed protein product [Oppiella nova]